MATRRKTRRKRSRGITRVPKVPVTCFIVVPDVDRAVRFYSKVFGPRCFKEIERYQHPADHRVWFATALLNGAPLQMAEPFPDMALVAPPKRPSVARGEGDYSMLSLEVNNVDRVFKRAVEHGATPIVEPYTAHWGARYAEFRDVSGHRIATCGAALIDFTILERRQAFMKNVVEKGVRTPVEIAPVVKDSIR